MTERGHTERAAAPQSDTPSGIQKSDAQGEGFVGRYQLCFELAAGGMAKVYLARIEGVAGFEKLVALKRIHQHLADEEEFVEMFLDEARIASRINHPNVCTVFDFGRSGEDYYLAMEFLMGEPMSRVMRTAVHTAGMLHSKRWTALMLRTIAEACEGLHAAHELRNDRGELLNVIHRDVSPHNVFIGFDGGVKIVDFGIASATDRLHTTQVGTVKGRHAYMAPEQAQGKPLDRRADVWSLGVILWETLTGKRLFKRASEVETLAALVRDPIPGLSETWPEVPSAVEEVVMKALSRDREQRWPTARHMGRAIDQALMQLQYPAGKAELSELMDELFTEQRAERQRMVEQARTMRAGLVRRVGEGEGSESEVRAPASMEEPTVQQPPPRKRALAAFSLAGGMIGGVAITLVVANALFGDAPAVDGSAAETAPGAIEAVAPDEPVPVVEPAPAVFEPEPAEPEPEIAARAEQESEPAPVAVAEPSSEAEERAVQAPSDAREEEPAADEGAATETEEEADHRVARSFRPRPRPVAQEPGTVSVVTPGGWADVFSDGSRIGRTPGQFQLPAGRHTLVLRPFGEGAPVRRTVEVPSGGRARVSVPVEAP